MSQASPVRSLSPSSPTSPFVSHDDEFGAVLGDAPRLVHVVQTDAHEGPVYIADEDALYFTSVPKPGSLPGPGSPTVAVKRLALDGHRFPLAPDRVTVVRADANVANGMALDREGHLVVCEQGTRSERARIARVAPPETIVDEWRGLPLNSPNDVVVKSDGSIWFTDPTYGALQDFRPEPLLGDYVYRHDPATGSTAVVADQFDKPNGICFSPDERVLYVTDSGANQEAASYYVDRPHHIKAFEIVEGCRLAGERLFAVVSPGFPDGIKVDADGRVYSSSFSGVQVFNLSGDLIGEISLPGAINFCFGGPDRNVLFITTDDAIWAAVLAATGP